MNNCFRVQIYAFNIIRTQKNDFFFRKSADYAIFVLFKDKYFAVCLIGVVVGSIIYRLIVTFVVNTNFISANDMKLFTAIVVAVAIIIANKGGKKRV